MFLSTNTLVDCIFKSRERALANKYAKADMLETDTLKTDMLLFQAFFVEVKKQNAF